MLLRLRHSSLSVRLRVVFEPNAVAGRTVGG